MNKIIQETAWGVLISAPQQLFLWAKIAGIPSIFSEEEKPNYFLGWPNCRVLEPSVNWKI